MQRTEDIRSIGKLHDNYEAGLLERTFGAGNETILYRFGAQWGQPVSEAGFMTDASLNFNYRGLSCSVIATSEYNTVTKMFDSYLDFVATYTPADGFQLYIEREGLISGLAKFFGSRDFEIGDKNFDDAFNLSSNHNARLKELCDQIGVKNAMLRAGSCELATHDPGWLSSVPEGKRMLRYRIDGCIGSVQALNSQLQAFGDMIDGLVESRSVKSLRK